MKYETNSGGKINMEFPTIINLIFISLVSGIAYIHHKRNEPYLSSNSSVYLFLIVIFMMGWLGLEYSTDLPTPLKLWTPFYCYTIYDAFKRRLVEKYNDLR